MRHLIQYSTLCLKRNNSSQHCHSGSSGTLIKNRMVLPIAVFVLLVLLFFIQPAEAEPLDLVIENLIDNNCTILQGAGGTPEPGGELDNVCAATGGSGNTSTGGGAGTPTTAPSILQKRMEGQGKDQAEAMGTDTVSELVPGWSVFLSAEAESLDRDVTLFEDGYDSSIWRLTLGTDYQLTEKSIVGLALTTTRQDGNFTGGGDFETGSYGFIAFASYSPSENGFVQLSIGYSLKDYDRTRDVSVVSGGVTVEDGSVTADFDGSELSTGILIGYDYTVGRLTIGPRIGLDWVYTEIDGYTEQGSTGLELVFDDADETSFQSRVGFTGSMAFSTGFGVLIPQFSADWVHEFADDQRDLVFSFKGDTSSVDFSYEDEEPDSNFFELALGLSAVLPNGWLPFIQARAIVGHDFLDSYSGSLGIRKEF